MAVGELKTLQTLYKSGLLPQHQPVAVTWRPSEVDFDHQVNTLSMIANYTVPEEYPVAKEKKRGGKKGGNLKQSTKMDRVGGGPWFSAIGGDSGGKKKGRGWGGLFKDRGESIWLESRSSFPSKPKKVVHIYKNAPFQGEGKQAPGNAYGPPDANYGPPDQSYGPPAQNYGPPAQNYGPPAQSNEPGQSYGQPGQDYSTVPQSYGPGDQNQGQQLVGSYTQPPAQKRNSIIPKSKRRVGGGSSSGGIPKGETIWLESGTKFPSSSSGQGSKYRRHGKYGLSSSSSGSGGYAKPKAEKGCFCSIGRTEKGDDAALITLGSIGIPLAIAGALLGSALANKPSFTDITNPLTCFICTITQIIQNPGVPPNCGTLCSRRRSFTDGFPAILTWPILLMNNYRQQIGSAWSTADNFRRSFQDSAVVHLWKLVSRGFQRSCGTSRGEQRMRRWTMDMKVV